MLDIKQIDEEKKNSFHTIFFFLLFRSITESDLLEKSSNMLCDIFSSLRSFFVYVISTYLGKFFIQEKKYKKFKTGISWYCFNIDKIFTFSYLIFERRVGTKNSMLQNVFFIMTWCIKNSFFMFSLPLSTLEHIYLWCC